jgi:hypothetical protein
MILLYVLTRTIANDQLQLLLRNALQILAIVKAQFPGVDFDNVEDVKDCDGAHGQDQSLACQWKDASRMIQEYRQSGSDVKPALTALYRVSMPV